MRIERLEARELLAGLDTNGDGVVAPIDALQVINWINEPGQAYESRLDVNDDGEITPNDVLRIVNYLNATNEPPEGMGATTTLDENSVHHVFGLLGGISDPNGHEMKISMHSQPEHGTVSVEGSQATYTPDRGYDGEDQFDYYVRDELGLVTVFTATITVNDIPEPAARHFTIRVDAEPLGSRTPASNWNDPHITAEGMIEGVRRAADEMTKWADVDFTITTSGPADWWVERAVVYVNGQHFRGQANSARIQIHSGFAPGGTHSCRDAPCHVGFVSPAFWGGGIPQLKRIAQHELLHTSFAGLGHTGNTNCIMHPNASAEVPCQAERNFLASRWGASKTPEGRDVQVR
jgi:hypothetical protein